MIYQKEITELEYKILRTNIINVNYWFNNIFDSKIYSLKQTLIPIVVKNCIEQQIQIPNTENQIIELGFEKGWIKESEPEPENEPTTNNL